MNILSIDTTTKVASVSILYNDKIIEKSISNEVTHSEKMLPLIDEVLKENSITLDNIDMYACINGPGSFTGIRIGLSTLKAFSLVDNKKIFSMSSTDLLTYTGYKHSNLFKNKEKAIVISIIDARNDRVYYTVNELSLDNNNNNNKININNILKQSNEDISTFISSLPNNYTNVIFTGDCVEKYKDIIKEKYIDAILFNYYPTTTDLINAYEDINNTNNYIFDSYTLDANYVRVSQAERMQNNG